MLVESFLEESAARWPDKTAIVCGRRRTTFAQLETAANRLAHGLAARGVDRRDRVVIHMGNSVETVVSLFAVLKTGAVFAIVNPSTKTRKLAHILNHCRASALIAPMRRLARHEGLWDRAEHLKTIVVTGPAKEVGGGVGDLADNAPADAVSLDWLTAEHVARTTPPRKHNIDVDLAALVYTSGTTGNPKGVMLTHRNMVAAAESVVDYLKFAHDDVVLSVLPLAFGYGLYQVLMGVKVGATVILERSFTYPHAVMNRLVDERVNGMPLVPTMMAVLLQLDLSAYDLSHLRYITNAGAALPTDYVRRVRKLLPHVDVYSMYGQTECKRVCFLPPEEIDRRPDSVGKAMPNTEAYVVDASGRKAGPGEVGELVVRGAHVMAGYWEMPKETAEALGPGPLPGERVLYTGDLFRTDRDGYLYFVSRKDDIIKSRGEKVSPKEIENVLCEHPAIAEAAVFGTPDKVLGEAICAVVVPREGQRPAEADVLRHCARHLEDLMVPHTVQFRDALPRTDNGKVDKKALRRPSVAAR